MEIFIGIVGVIVGFLLNEFSMYFRKIKQLKKKKTAIDTELKSLKGQIPQLKSICGRAIDELKSRSLLPTMAIPAITQSYDKFGHEILELLTQKERNLLHIVYNHLKVTDKVLSELEKDFKESLAQGVFTDTFEAFANRLSDIYSSYDRILNLIDSYLKGNPIDVFNLERG